MVLNYLLYSSQICSKLSATWSLARLLSRIFLVHCYYNSYFHACNLLITFAKIQKCFYISKYNKQNVSQHCDLRFLTSTSKANVLKNSLLRLLSLLWIMRTVPGDPLFVVYIILYPNLLKGKHNNAFFLNKWQKDS